MISIDDIVVKRANGKLISVPPGTKVILCGVEMSGEEANALGELARTTNNGVLNAAFVKANYPLKWQRS